ncbi:neuron-specific vesicular protein calcyon isoform X5 [Emydura macquarii macquarii]|uniref:neuron-specific vesicular protein calcyon isoform X5 n=1 Tax=Emydura macquarii macquarii TaxID=1129001 RepID=UPI00352BBE03
MIGLPVRGRSASTLNRPVPAGPEHRSLTMVKLGSNLSKKPDKEPGAAVGGDDSFDNIPLITPLDVSQLQQPFPDKVIVKTRTEYQLQQKKKRKLHVPGIKKLNINLYDEVSEKVKAHMPRAWTRTWHGHLQGARLHLLGGGGMGGDSRCPSTHLASQRLTATGVTGSPVISASGHPECLGSPRPNVLQ